MTSKILRQTLILIDLKRYHRELKKGGEASKMQAGEKVRGLYRAGDAVQRKGLAWFVWCAGFAVVTSMQAGKGGMSQRERQVGKLGLSLAKVVGIHSGWPPTHYGSQVCSVCAMWAACGPEQ